MTKNQANLLRAFSLWTVFVWATRIKNVIDQSHKQKNPAAFVAVHVALAVVSLAFAVGCWVVVTRNRGKNAPKLVVPATKSTSPN
jgi:hypothetical protein